MSRWTDGQNSWLQSARLRSLPVLRVVCGGLTTSVPSKPTSPASLAELAWALVGGLINSLTAQCSRTLNLKTAGVPGYALPTDAAYLHTSLEGYSGINAKSYTGSLDSIQFVTASGAVSPVYGAPNIPGAAVSLSCSAGSKNIGIFGWQDSYVSSIGIICSIGEQGVQSLGRSAGLTAAAACTAHQGAK
jgi:hypothetical protein